jgi:hypothetical protein
MPLAVATSGGSGRARARARRDPRVVLALAPQVHAVELGFGVGGHGSDHKRLLDRVPGQ